MLYPILNSIGLVLDIIGAVLLFKYGLPDEVSPSGTIGLAVKQADPIELERAELYRRRGLLGLRLLIGGFAIQLGSNLLQLWCTT